MDSQSDSGKSLTEREDELFDEWKCNLPAEQGFVTDGAVNACLYDQSPIKVVFVLKEANAEGESWDLRKFLRGGGRTEWDPTWVPVARWAYAIAHLSDETEWSELKPMPQCRRASALGSIVAVDLKKTPGRGSANDNRIKEFVQHNQDMLRRQLSLYNPDYVIGCGITDILFPDVLGKPNWSTTSRGIRYASIAEANSPLTNTSSVYFDYYHPNARVRHSLLHYGLIDAVAEVHGK